VSRVAGWALSPDLAQDWRTAPAVNRFSPLATPTSQRSIRVQIAPGTLFTAMAIVGGVWLLGHLISVLVVVAGALMFAVALLPFIRLLERRMSRRWALGITGLSVLVAVLLACLVTIPSVWNALSKFIGDFPRFRDGIVRTLQSHSVTESLAQSVQRLSPENLVGGIETEAALAFSARMFAILGLAVTGLFLSFYLLGDSERLLAAVHALVPRRHHERLGRMLQDLETIVGGYIRGQLLTSAAIGVFTFILLTVLRVPDALALAALASLADVLPFVGGILATIPSVLVALQRGTGIALAVAVVLVAYQEFESRLLIPRLYGQTLKLPSSVVVVALLAGGTLGGVPGALFALPLAASVLAAVKELGLRLPGVTRRPHSRADAA
jgi:predicted PurR-regulated permease PerM